MKRLLTHAATVVALCAWGSIATAQLVTQAPLPEPLTLPFALSLIDDEHPVLLQQQANLARSQAELHAADAETSLSAGLLARARVIDPHPDARDQGHDDHAFRLIVEKPLYDFGRSELSIQAARSAHEGEEWMLLATRQQRWLSIATDYFQVLLADLRYTHDNEAMAIAFVGLQRAQQRNRIGQLSDVDLLALESAYQRSRQRRTESAGERRAVRARLAHALNRPETLPSRLLTPHLLSLDASRPEFEGLVKQAMENNPRLQALRLRRDAARSALQAVRADSRPIIVGEAQSGLNSRSSSSADRWRVGVMMQIPLFSGGRLDARIAKARSEIVATDAVLARESLNIREQLLRTWLAVESLAVRRNAAEVDVEYRDLYLDRSRAQYELQLRSDLGDAMVESTRAQLEMAAVEFAVVLNQARMQMLLGVEPENLTRRLFGEQ